MAQFEGIPIRRKDAETLDSTKHLLHKTKFTDAKQVLDFYEENRRFFTSNDDLQDSLLMYMTLLRRVSSVVKKSEQPQKCVSQYRMVVNDLSKLITAVKKESSFEVKLKD